MNSSSNMAFTFPITPRQMFAEYTVHSWLHIGLEVGSGVHTLSLPFDNNDKAKEAAADIQAWIEVPGDEKTVWIEHAFGGARIPMNRVVFTVTE